MAKKKTPKRRSSEEFDDLKGELTSALGALKQHADLYHRIIEKAKPDTLLDYRKLAEILDFTVRFLSTKVKSTEELIREHPDKLAQLIIAYFSEMSDQSSEYAMQAIVASTGLERMSEDLGTFKRRVARACSKLEGHDLEELAGEIKKLDLIVKVEKSGKKSGFVTDENTEKLHKNCGIMGDLVSRVILELNEELGQATEEGKKQLRSERASAKKELDSERSRTEGKLRSERNRANALTKARNDAYRSLITQSRQILRFYGDDLEDVDSAEAGKMIANYRELVKPVKDIRPRVRALLEEYIGNESVKNPEGTKLKRYEGTLGKINHLSSTELRNVLGSLLKEKTHGFNPTWKALIEFYSGLELAARNAYKARKGELEAGQNELMRKYLGDKDALARKIEELQGQKTEFDERKRSLDEKIAAYGRDKGELDAKENKLREDNDAYESVNETLGRRNAELQGQWVQFDKRKSKLEEAVAAYGRDKSEFDAINSVLEQDKIIYERENSELDERKKDLEERKGELEDKTRQLEADYTRQKDLLDERKIQLGEDRAAHEIAGSQLEASKRKLEERKGELEADYTRQRDLLDERKNKLEASRGELEDKNRQLEADYTTQKALLSKRKNKLGESKRELDAEKADYKIAKKELDKKSVELREQEIQLEGRAIRLTDGRTECSRGEEGLKQKIAELSRKSLALQKQNELFKSDLAAYEADPRTLIAEKYRELMEYVRNNPALTKDQLEGIIKNGITEAMQPYTQRLNDLVNQKPAGNVDYDEFEKRISKILEEEFKKAHIELRPSDELKQTLAKQAGYRGEAPQGDMSQAPAQEGSEGPAYKTVYEKDAPEGERQERPRQERPEEEKPETTERTESAKKPEEKETPKEIKPIDISTGVQEFWNAVEKSQRLVDTLEADVLKTYIDNLDSIRDENGIIDYKLLKKDGDRDGMMKKVGEALADLALKYAKREGKADIFDVNRLMFGYLGFTMGYVMNLFEKGKDRLTLEAFYNTVCSGKEAAIMPAVNTIAETANLCLSKDIAEEVVEATNTKGRVAPKKLGVDEMRELLVIHRANGGEVLNRDLKGKNYLIDDYKPEQAIEQRLAA